ncbi:MAG: hypothetical protein ACYCW6_06080 [Candidatus Xenobia bacterium]
MDVEPGKLHEMVAEAIRDCDAPWEQVLGLYGRLQSRLALPFQTELLGRAVTVETLGLDGEERIVAQVRQGERRRELPLLDLPLPSPPPRGVEWIAAYRHYLGSRRVVVLKRTGASARSIG